MKSFCIHLSHIVAGYYWLLIAVFNFYSCAKSPARDHSIYTVADTSYNCIRETFDRLMYPDLSLDSYDFEEDLQEFHNQIMIDCEKMFKSYHDSIMSVRNYKMDSILSYYREKDNRTYKNYMFKINLSNNGEIESDDPKIKQMHDEITSWDIWYEDQMSSGKIYLEKVSKFALNYIEERKLIYVATRKKFLRD